MLVVYAAESLPPVNSPYHFPHSLHSCEGFELDLEKGGNKFEKEVSLDPVRIKGRVEAVNLKRSDRKVNKDQGKDKGKVVQFHDGARMCHEVGMDINERSKRSVNLTQLVQKGKVVAVVNSYPKKTKDGSRLFFDKRRVVWSKAESGDDICPLRSDFGVVLGQKVECGKNVRGRSKKGDGGSDLSGESCLLQILGPNIDSHSLAFCGPNEGFFNVSTVGKSNPLKDSGMGQFFIDLGTVVETFPNISKRRRERDSFLSIKSHSMKLRNSKDNFKFSSILEDKLVKVIETGVGLGMDFNGKEVGMAKIFAENRRKKKLGM
ncbi:hypothetical protein LWI28_001880 [Acer negundo]|uniref:Uncharacterized protein n=1 Tax=Acer negundo TaxID=4023 RepID=A0AAD5IBJ9_ACENE|nr:hypothetical protein LWI28_001880 [Acer negundo]